MTPPMFFTMVNIWVESIWSIFIYMKVFHQPRNDENEKHDKVCFYHRKFGSTARPYVSLRVSHQKNK